MINYYLRQLFKLNIIKTIYINFKLLPIKKAIIFPIFVHYKTELANLTGKITINGKIRPGMLEFGDFNREILGTHLWRKVEIRGEVEINGYVRFGVGTTFFVDKKAKVIFGDNIIIGGKCKIVCITKIKFGNNIRVAYESQIVDTNFHFLRNIKDDTVENCASPITIGNNNWIGNRVSIMKGTSTPDFFIVGSNSLLNKNYLSTFEPYSVVGGVPIKLLKNGFERVYDFKTENDYKKKFRIV